MSAALDALVIAPHPDDAELGAAGLILKLKEQGRRVGVLDLTSGEPTPHGTPEIRSRETAAATALLGLDWRENLGLPNRRLEATLAARAQLAGVIRQQRPRWVLAPYWVDSHPDHVAATELIEAARFWAKLTKSDLPGEPFHPARIFYYFCVHLRQVMQPAFVLDISQHWDAKLAAIRCYQSQFVTGKDPMFLEQFRDEASYWGRLIGTRYGEPYAAREPVALSGLSELL
jgi:bacillithiol biosynthesis deacetylase BshB1